MSDASQPRAVVLLSGGLDSATCLAEARAAGYACHALSVAYGQRHNAELAAARTLAKQLHAAEYRQVAIDLNSIGGSALTDPAIDVPTTPTEEIPATYVPARNTTFLSIALGYAEVIGAQDLYIGVNTVDYSGYPDCRPAFIAAFEALARLATRAGAEEGAAYRVHTPLAELSKAGIVRRALELGVDIASTVSCYQADARGRACGVCDACRLRRRGFEEAGIADPTRYQPGRTENTG